MQRLADDIPSTAFTRGVADPAYLHRAFEQFEATLEPHLDRESQLLLDVNQVLVRRQTNVQ
jgi:hypothetical protein